MAIEPYRFVCPTKKAHVTVFERVNHMRCRTCGENFDYVIDLKTGKRVTTKRVTQ